MDVLRQVAASLALVVLAGCMGPATISAPRPTTGGDVPEGTVTLTGHVVDEEQLPLEGVAVTIAGRLDLYSATDADGAFELAGIDPGLRTLYFQKLGYVTASRDVHVALDPAPVLDVTLAAMPRDFPFAHHEMRDGFLGLDVAAPVFAFPLGRTVDPENEKSTFRFAIERGLETILAGVRWEHSGPLSAGRLQQQVLVEQNSESRVSGASPLAVRVDKWAAKDGKNLTVVVGVPASKIENPQEFVVVAYQQRFELHLELHYHAPALPEDLSPFP